MAAPVLQLKRGLLVNLPGLRGGEPGFTTDSFDLYVGIDSTTSNNKFFGSHRYWTKNTASTGSGVNFVEGTTNGTDYLTLKAPDSLAGIVTYTLPGTQGASSSVLTNNGSGTLSWASGSANPVFTGIASFTDTTDNTLGNADTGAVQIDGGLGINKNLTVGANLNVQGHSEFVGVVTFRGGTINIGDSSTDNINIGGEFISNLVANDDATYDIGIGTQRWRNAVFSGIITATTFVGALTGTATSTTNIPNLTGAITSANTVTSLGSFTSAQLATALTDETGSGANVFATSPTLVTPVLGTPASGTLTNCTGLPISSGVSGLAANVATFLATPSSVNLATAVTDETGSGSLVFATSPTLVTPVLGAATATSIVVGSGVTINASGVNASGIITATTFVGAVTGTATSTTNIPNLTGAITSVNTTTSLGSFTSAQLATALTDETGSGANVFATSPTLVTPVLGTPASGTLTNCTGLPISSGVSGLAANVATFLATPSSSNLATALTDETGSGSAVFATSPTLVTPVLGAASATSIEVSGAVNVGTALSAPTVKTATIQHSNGTGAATIDTSGNITAAQNLTISGNLFVNGSTTQVNTTALTVEDRTIDLGIVNGAAPSANTTWDLGILFNYYSSSAKKSAVIWEHADARFKFASVAGSDTDGTTVDTPQLTVTTFAPIEIGQLWVTDCAGTSQVINCSGTTRTLENITIDAGTF